MGTHPLFSLDKEHNGKKPRLQWQVCVVENCLRCYAKLVAAFAAFKLLLCRQLADLLAFAAEALDAERPAKFLEQFPASLIRRVHRVDFGECHG
jgi:hypothetical protein